MFSVAGALRTWTELLQVVARGGLYQAVCTPSFITEDRVAGLWTYLFVLSKVMELIYYLTLALVLGYKILLLTSKELFSWSQLFFFANSTYLCDNRLR